MLEGVVFAALVLGGFSFLGLVQILVDAWTKKFWAKNS